MTDSHLSPLHLSPDLRVRPWAGNRLAPADQHIGEAWLAGPASVVRDGPLAGITLDELATDLGTDLVGSRGMLHGRGRFPLLVKLIDAAQWLSVQVHPDDAQALAMEGEPGIGKSEAWLVLDAGPDAELLLGPDEAATPEAVREAIGTEALPGLLRRIRVGRGDRIDVPAGTLHAIGPDLFVYEIQQPCDITYRAWDWGRTDRTVHTQQSIAVADPAARGAIVRAATDEGDPIVASSPFFTARRIHVEEGSVADATDGVSPHVVTLLAGAASVVTAGGAARLGPYDTVVLPAALGEYRLEAAGPASLVVATVP